METVIRVYIGVKKSIYWGYIGICSFLDMRSTLTDWGSPSLQDPLITNGPTFHSEAYQCSASTPADDLVCE